MVILLLLVGGCSDSEATDSELSMHDGYYEGMGEGRSGYIVVGITVQNGKIMKIVVLKQSESTFAQSAEQEIIQRVLAANSVEVDAVTGATLTSNGMIQAISAAIDASKGIIKTLPYFINDTTDVVVIGAGGAGLSAAAELSSLGHSVVVLEKQANIGGNTIGSFAGINAAGTVFQQALGIKDSAQLFFDDTMKGGHYLNDSCLVRSLVNHAPETLDWLTGLGADLTDVGLMAGASVKRCHRPQGGAPIGPHLLKVLMKAIEGKDVEVRLKNKVVGLLSEEGRVTGVKVEQQDGSVYELHASAVIIATGGFGANLDMVTHYRKDLAGFETTNHPGATGDAFAWAEAVGAQLVQMDQIQAHPTVELTQNIVISEAVRGSGALLINRDGVEFVDPLATRDVVSEAILKQKGCTAFIVFDEDVRHSYSGVESYLRQQILTQRATPAELATAFGLPPEAVTETMAKMKTPPYYGVEVSPAIHHTMGGLKVDSLMRVIGKDGQPIKGLFAAGEVTGGIHGGNRLGGNAVADITINGKIAADAASAGL